MPLVRRLQQKGSRQFRALSHIQELKRHGVYSNIHQHCFCTHAATDRESFAAGHHSEAPRPENSAATREAILEAALGHVQTMGWSVDAIARGCSENNLSVASVGMFSGGAGDLVLYFLRKCNKELDAKLIDLKAKKPSAEERFSGVGEEEKPSHARTTEKLAAAVQMRLEMILPFIETWPQAMTVAALPQNASNTMKIQAELLDIIWQHVGDQTESVEWYSRRAALAAVYAATELHLLTDKSPSKEATWNFLGGRLQEASFIGKQLSDLARNSHVMKGLMSSTLQAAQSAIERNGPPK